MIRTFGGCAAVVLGLLISPTMSAAAACEGAGCRATANAKPLNIMQFMREQAASTRGAQPRHRSTRAAAKVHRVPHRAIAARRKSAPVPPVAAASFASRPASAVQDVASDEHKTIDRIADAAAVATMDAAIPFVSDVQLVDAKEFNDIDRKAEGAGPASVNMTQDDKGPAQSEQVNVSWLHWIWSAVGSTFAALATAVHQLISV
jgi:hypothetical protein